MKILALTLALLSGCGWVCKRCPPPPPAPPPKIVEIRKSCMDPLPELIVPVIPDPPEGATSVQLDRDEFRQLFVLIATLRSYLEVQLDRCKVP